MTAAIYAGRLEAQFFVPSGATVTATNGAGTGKSIPMPANGYYLSDFITQLQLQLNTFSDSAAWTIALDVSTGQVTINCTGTFSFFFTSVEIRQLLGFPADINAATTPQLGTAQARGLWIPDCPLALDSDPAIAPTKSDLRATQSPTANVFGLVGNFFYTHTNLRWTHVPKNRVWTGLEVLANQSYQTFLKDTQWSVGANELGLWFRVQSLCQIYGGGVKVGTNLANGWALIGVDAFTPTLSAPPTTALYGVTIPTIVSVGGP